jgi:hypothetical protein
MDIYSSMKYTYHIIVSHVYILNVCVCEKVGTVHEGVNEHVMHWAEAARYLILRRLDE